MDAMARFSVAGRTALVTGASYGLGANFADYLAHAKANVVLAARSTDKLETVAKQLEADGCSVLPLTCDVADPASVKQAFAAAFEHFGRVDILVNNAGVSAEAGVFPERVPDDLFAQTVSVNLNGLFTCCREVAARWLADGKGGSIINVASVAGLGGQQHFPPAYQATKAAVINLTRNLACSWADRGVRVNAIAPGWFPSEMTAAWFASPPTLDRFTRQAPMNRIGDPEELAGVLLFLASDASSFVTGQTIAVDGGLSASMGAFPYTEEVYAVQAAFLGEPGTPITPAG